MLYQKVFHGHNPLLDIHSPSVNLTEAVSYKQSAITIESERIWVLLLNEIFVVMLGFFEIRHRSHVRGAFTTFFLRGLIHLQVMTLHFLRVHQKSKRLILEVVLLVVDCSSFGSKNLIWLIIDAHLAPKRVTGVV